MRMSARMAIDHLKILCKVGVLQRRIGRNRREVEYVIHPGFVRKAEDGTAIFDFGGGQLHFPACAAAGVGDQLGRGSSSTECSG